MGDGMVVCGLERKYMMEDGWGTPEDLSGIIVFLSSDSSSYITAQDFYVDGGWLFKGL